MTAASLFLRAWLPFRSLARQAGPHLLEATLGPTACFLTGRAVWGIDGALALALAWTGGCLALRHLRGRRTSGLLLIGMVTLLLRASVSFALHSERAYLVAPALVTVVLGAVYLGSALTAKPLLGRVVGDLLPRSWADPDDARVTRLCRIGSAVFGGEQIISALVSLAMILHLSTTTYVMVHEPVSWLVFAVVAASVAPFFWPDISAIRAERRDRVAGADEAESRGSPRRRRRPQRRADAGAGGSFSPTSSVSWPRWPGAACAPPRSGRPRSRAAHGCAAHSRGMPA
jgi:hypothetical protein